jgi:Zn-dependent protease
MFSLPSVRIGTFFGIPIELNPTWFIIFVLVAASLAFGTFPAQFKGWGTVGYIVAGLVAALLFFASVVIHELMHSVVAKAGGLQIERVTLFIFGGVAQMAEEPKTAGAEFVMAIAGPLTSIVLSGLFFVAELAAKSAGAASWIWGPLAYLATINLFVGVFNLLPGFPLDGGRVLRAALWGATGDLLKATRWAARSGQFIGYTMVALAVFGVLRGSLGAIWFGLIGWFIAMLADGAYRQQVAKTQLHGTTVGQAMSAQPVLAPGEITLEQLAHDFFLGNRHSRYPVLIDGHVAGLVSLPRAKTVPRHLWASTRVADIADRDMEQLSVDAAAPLDAVLPRLTNEAPGALLVVSQDRLVGILTRADVISRLRRSDL